MTALLFCLLLVLPATALATPAIHHSHDDAVWPLPGDLRRPASGLDEVTVVFDARAATALCPGLASRFDSFFSDPAQGLALGEACGRWLVLFNRPRQVDALGERGRAFLAAHEAFHLAVQIHGGLQRPDRILPRRESSVRERALLRIVRADLRRARPDFCSRFTRAYSRLGSTERDNLRATTHWEWPAEYYARRQTFGADAADAYPAARRLLGSALEYGTGADAVDALVRARGAAAVAASVWAGNNLLDDYLQMRDCAPVDAGGLRVPVARLPLFPP